MFILASAIAATLAPAAMAQPPEVRHDNGEIRQDYHDLREAQRYGDGRDVYRARREIADDRADRSQDWRDYRRSHPDVYRGPAYAGPRPGWRYRPVAAGYRFDPTFYDRRYWVDPVRYRLPAYGPDRRWVRYGNDVVLVNMRDGRVLNVYNGFFY
jgi:Ni/Co efflux regulator RcnB